MSHHNFTLTLTATYRGAVAQHVVTREYRALLLQHKTYATARAARTSHVRRKGGGGGGGGREKGGMEEIDGREWRVRI